MAVLELKVSMCLQKVPCIAEYEGSPDFGEQTKEWGSVLYCCPSGDTGSVMSMSCSAWSPALHCWDAWKALRTDQGREHSRDLEAVVKEGCSDKAGGCHNQIWESSAAGELDLVLEKVYLKYTKFNKFHQWFSSSLMSQSDADLNTDCFQQLCSFRLVFCVFLHMPSANKSLRTWLSWRCRPEWEGDQWGRTSAWDLTLTKPVSACFALRNNLMLWRDWSFNK